MGGLFSALGTSSIALEAFTQALGVSQQNIANASTPGYAAQRAAIQPIGDSGISAGADLVELSSTGSAHADALVQSANSRASASQNAVTQLTSLNQVFDITGSTGILAALQNFGAAFASLGVSPNDSALRSNAVNAAAGVASAFQQTAASLESLGTSVKTQIGSTADEINALTSKIAGLNRQATVSAQGSAATNASLRSALDQLSSLVDINVSTSPDGTVSVLAGGQLPLVIGGNSYALSVNPQASEGAQVASSAGGHSPTSFSGQLGALLDTVNNVLNPILGTATSAGSLNTLAAGFASRVNTLLGSGTTASGTAGPALFSYDTNNPSDAAASLSVVASFSPDQLALASGGASGESNGIANQLAALPASADPADLIDGKSAQDCFSSIAAGVGGQLSSATAQSAEAQTALTAAQVARTQRSGVSLDQEAINVTNLQNAYAANARLVAILDQLSADAVNLLTPTAA